MTLRPSIRGVVVVSAFGVAFAGCSTGGGATSTTIPITHQVDRERFKELLLQTQLGIEDPDAPLQFDYLLVEEAERSVVECMARSGFVYSVLPQQAFFSPPVGYELSEQERVAKFGFGITTNLVVPSFDFDDPNESYYESLSPSGRAEFDRDVSRCRLAAHEAQQSLLTLSDEMDRRVVDLRAEIDANRDVVRAADRYQACMDHHGFQESSPSAARLDVLKRLRAEQVAGAVSTASDDLHDFEIDVATADLLCGGDYKSVRRNVQLAAAQTFLERYGSELPELPNTVVSSPSATTSS